MDRDMTGHVVFCMNSQTHPRTIAAFARPLTMPRGQFEEEAEEAGWRYDEQTRAWKCPDCVQARAADHGERA
jgi:hypothetical protein